MECIAMEHANMGVSEEDSFTYLDDLVDIAGSFQKYSAVSQLCIPQDSIDDVELFPNFKDDFISFNFDCFPEPNSSNKQSWLLEEEDEFRGGFVNKKGRSKRGGGGGRKWIEQKESILPEEEKVKCTHCKTEKTPQWRMGPGGAKTLCNACGMRYKSGRLVPEYRPAASPTFDCYRHSNFHKKIMKRKGIC